MVVISLFSAARRDDGAGAGPAPWKFTISALCCSSVRAEVPASPAGY